MDRKLTRGDRWHPLPARSKEARGEESRTQSGSTARLNAVLDPGRMAPFRYPEFWMGEVVGIHTKRSRV